LLLSTLAPGCVIPISSVGPDAAGANSSSDGGLVTADGASNAGLPWTSVTGTLAGMDSECGNLSNLSAKPDEDLLIAGIALKGLWASGDGGGHWQALGTSAGSATITHRPTSIAYDPQDSMRYWESGIYGNSGGVYETRDDGKTFVQLGTVRHTDQVSVDFSDPNRQTILAGGHEQAMTLNRSTDGGMTWTNVGAGLPANTNCTHPLVIDGQTHLVGCGGYGGGPSGVYRTTNGGANWTQVTASGGANEPLRASDGSIYWASPDGNGMTRGTADGQQWTNVVGSGVIASVRPIELPDRRLATLGSRSVVVSSDHGATWSSASSTLPYSDAFGVVYSVQRKAFYVWHFTCGDGAVPVPPDAIMRFDFDYQKR
jgi:hypothetical protein